MISPTSFVLALESFSVSWSFKLLLSCLICFEGDNHVFRFNNPEEVRKQRNRATMKSNLQQGFTAADLENSGESMPVTRAESTVSSIEDDMDWTFAQREAALARLGLDPTLDNLPDDDLNKLFDKITQVKTMRDHHLKPRPESSLSQADDLWSETGRQFASDATTDDTSVDALGSPRSRDTIERCAEPVGKSFACNCRVVSRGGRSESRERSYGASVTPCTCPDEAYHRR